MQAPSTSSPQHYSRQAALAALPGALPLALHGALSGFAPALPLAVAFSGGADSTALLLACAQLFPGQVRAIHVHHGLQAAAEDFAAFCQQLCAAQRIPLRLCRVDARPAAGQSPEDAARQSRYAALTQACAQDWQDAEGHALPGPRSIALAQHADDQVETLLLALSRGAGVAGLAAMPAHWQRAGLDWHRPLLTVPGAQLRQWLQSAQQAWVEDPSNSDPAYTRNRIRAQLLPVLEQAFPQFRSTFARSSAHCAQADELLQEVAQADLGTVGLPPTIKALQLLSRARQANVLRYWLRSEHGTTPTAAQLAQLQWQIAACVTRGHQIRLKVGRGYVQRQAGVLDWYN